MRRVGRIERFGAELQRQAFLDAEFAEKTAVKIDRAGTFQQVETRRSETNRCDRGKRRWVVIRFARADAALTLGFARRGEKTVLADLRQEGSLYARFPRGAGCTAVTLNNGGGGVF